MPRWHTYRSGRIEKYPGADERLSGNVAHAIGELAATYYVGMLPEARETNATKVRRARHAYWLVGAGLGGLVLSLILTSVAAV